MAVADIVAVAAVVAAEAATMTIAVVAAAVAIITMEAVEADTPTVVVVVAAVTAGTRAVVEAVDTTATMAAMEDSRTILHPRFRTLGLHQVARTSSRLHLPAGFLHQTREAGKEVTAATQVHLPLPRQRSDLHGWAIRTSNRMVVRRRARRRITTRFAMRGFTDLPMRSLDEAVEVEVDTKATTLITTDRRVTIEEVVAVAVVATEVVTVEAEGTRATGRSTTQMTTSTKGDLTWDLDGDDFVRLDMRDFTLKILAMSDHTKNAWERFFDWEYPTLV